MFPLNDTNPSHTTPFVTWILIALNVFVFFIELSMTNAAELNRFLYQWGFVPHFFATHISLSEIATLFTMQFLHGGWMHLIGNMWILHIFGDNVEDRLGHVPYLIFYLSCGVLANFAQYFSDPTVNHPNIGASGAIAGVIGAYLYLFPHAKVNTLTLIGIVPLFFKVPSIVYAGLFFFLNWASAVYGPKTPVGGEHVAFWAHIGGFIAGFVLVRFLEAPRQVENKFYPDEYYPL